jgi:hypothetical protein
MLASQNVDTHIIAGTLQDTKETQALRLYRPNKYIYFKELYFYHSYYNRFTAIRKIFFVSNTLKLGLPIKRKMLKINILYTHIILKET